LLALTPGTTSPSHWLRTDFKKSYLSYLEVKTVSISISQFASDPNLLNLELWPKQRQILEEFWQGITRTFALGRRSGKTLMSSVVACYVALADEYKRHLRPGERFFIVSVANTIDQAKIALQGVKDLTISLTSSVNS